ncbi:BamA/TamA family outer membrane protein, partial [bacterium]|nr:BamA/TamA family outer membrane protein [bacterium]
MALASNDEEFEELEKHIDLLSRLEWLFEPSEDDGLVVIPIAFSNPTIGSGVGGAARWRYKLDEETEISHTTLGAAWAGDDGWAVGLLQRTFLKGDQFRINGTLGLFDVTRPFYGIGYDAGERGESIDLDQAGLLFTPEVLVRLGKNLHMGLRYRLLQVETTSNSSEISSGGMFNIPVGEQDAVSSGIGPTLTLDSRDSRYGPTSGALLDIISFIADQDLGSDFKYQTLKTEYSHYVTVGEEQVLALGLTGCFTSGDVPYYDLCAFGQKSNLRGYVA